MKHHKPWAQIIFGMLLLFSYPVAYSADVTPSDRVSNYINIREYPSTQDSDIVGQLRPGEQAKLLEEIPYWYKIRFGNNVEGYVSKSWASVVIGTSPYTPYSIHFLDVGVGDATVIDVGDKEIIIDGGNYKNDLHDYLRDTGIIDGPVELGVITHADSDHWKGFVRAFNLDGKASHPQQLLEFWEPGYDRDCRPLASYTQFIKDIADRVPSGHFIRPLQSTYQPTILSGNISTFEPDSLPGVKVTLLYSDAAPDGPDCAYRINNASIVMMVEISGVKILMMGDANGKDRDDAGDVTPAYIEKKLIDMSQIHPGILKADILKVGHHGSETASTQAFIDKVDPTFVIFSASTNHHLPRPTVVDRYKSTTRVLLRTDANRARNTDHIICVGSGHGKVGCNYADNY